MAAGKYQFSSRLKNKQSGFTYLAILFAIAIAGVILGQTGINWNLENQREKERELLFIGNQFRQGIAVYYERTPGAVKHYPGKLEDLLTDKRYSMPQHYLRKLYRDPFTNQKQWGLILSPEGGIMGVHSLSNLRPIKTTGFNYADASFKGAHSYSEWAFSYNPQTSAQQQSKR